MLSAPQKTKRQAERISKSLPVRVEAYETKKKVWREVTYLKSCSDIGAGFYLNRFFVVGQLLFLSFPHLKNLRRYDHEAEQYDIWGIVRHCHQIIIGKSTVYHVGVAFIGKEPPESYLENPFTIYKLGEIKNARLWEISEDDQHFSTRRQERYTITLDAFLAVCDEAGNVIAHEKTVTENISAGGVSVFSTMDLQIGDKVEFIRENGSFSAMAVVRNRRVGEDNLPRIHLEFIAARFPLEGIAEIQNTPPNFKTNPFFRRFL